MNYLLDTNHLSPLVTIGHPLRERIQTAANDGDTFAVIPLVLNEFMFGIGMLPRAKQNIQEWERLKPELAFYDVDTSDGISAAKLRIGLRKRGWQLELTDSFVAVAAMRHSLTLLTTDGDFSAITGIVHQNWMQP